MSLGRIIFATLCFLLFNSGCTLLLGTALGINFLADIEDIETLEKRAKRKKLAEHQVFYL